MVYEPMADVPVGIARVFQDVLGKMPADEVICVHQHYVTWIVISAMQQPCEIFRALVDPDKFYTAVIKRDRCRRQKFNLDVVDARIFKAGLRQCIAYNGCPEVRYALIAHRAQCVSQQA